MVLREKMDFAAIAVLVFFSTIPNILLMSFDENHFAGSGGASPLFYVFALSFYIVAFLGILVRLNNRIMPILRVWPVWLIVIFAFLSCFWSIEPIQTFSRSFGLLGTTIVAAFISTFPANRQLSYMTLAFSIVMGISLLIALALPSIGVMTHEGNRVVRGIYVHKNTAGWTSALFALVAFGAFIDKGSKKLIPAIALILSILSTLLSWSATGIVAIILGFAMFGALTFIRRSGKGRPVVLLFTGIGLVVAVALATTILPFVLESFDKSPTLSGRTNLWTALLPAIEQRPLLGWGFGGALWESETGRDFFKYVFFAGNAQGGYAEIIVSSGIIGCLLLFIPYIAAIVFTFKRSNQGDILSEVFCVILVIIAFMGITAPIFMAVNQMFWILTILPIFYMNGVSSPFERRRISSSSTRSILPR